MNIYVPPPPPEPWTKAEEDRLRILWNDEGLSAAQCGVLLNRSRSAVRGKAHRLNLAERPSNFHSGPKPPKGPKVERRAAPKLPAPQRLPSDTKALRGRAWDALPGAAPIPLLELHDGMCRWPIGDGKPYLFCGQGSGAAVYCEHHAALSRGRGTESERVAHRARRVAA